MKIDAKFVANYRPYAGLPPLAGLGTFEKAMQPGLSVEKSVERIKRYHFTLKRRPGIGLIKIAKGSVWILR